MTSDLAKGFGEPMITTKDKKNNMYGDTIGLVTVSSNSFERDALSYDLAADDSRYNDETVMNSTATEDTGVQNSRVVLVQRSTLTTSLESSAMLYLMSLFLPLVSVSNFNVRASWICSQRAALRATQICLCQLARLYEQFRAEILRLANDQYTRDLFSAAMDVVLVLYAIGFLFLSLYQASIIG